MRKTWWAAILWSAVLAACAPAAVAAADADVAGDATATVDAALSAPDLAQPDDAAADVPLEASATAAPDGTGDAFVCASVYPALGVTQTSVQATAEAHDPCSATPTTLPTKTSAFTPTMDADGNLTLTLTPPAQMADHWWPSALKGNYAVTIPATMLTGKQYLLKFSALHADTGPDPNDAVCHVAITTDATYDVGQAKLTVTQQLSSTCSHMDASRTWMLTIQPDLTICKAEFTGEGLSMPCGAEGHGWYDHFAAGW